MRVTLLYSIFIVKEPTHTALLVCVWFRGREGSGRGQRWTIWPEDFLC